MRHDPHLDVNFSNHKCYIVDRETKKIVALGVEDHGLFRLVDIGQVKEHALAAKSASDISTLWHQRYGHLNLTYLSQLAREKLVDGLPDIPQKIQGVCGACQAGKQHRTPFDEGQAWRAQRVLQLVHADICGPMNMTSITGARYFLLFVDDFSRKMWVYFLKLKSEVFNEFQKFKALVEKESGCHIASLRSDNGGEFCSKEFNNFCTKHGIQRQYTTPYTPQQNGVVERRNRTITEMARCMLQNRSVPNRFWVEAVFTTVYLLNRSPTMAVKQKTPEEAWSGRKPKVSHLKVFGSTAYTWIPAEKRTKLDPKSKKLMITGYNDTHKAYRLVDTDTDKVSFNRCCC
jgi:transposase InsO family protein